MASFAQHECGCAVGGTGEVGEPYRVVLCKRHGDAGSALKEAIIALRTLVATLMARSSPSDPEAKAAVEFAWAILRRVGDK